MDQTAKFIEKYENLAKMKYLFNLLIPRIMEVVGLALILLIMILATKVNIVIVFVYSILCLFVAFTYFLFFRVFLKNFNIVRIKYVDNGQTQYLFAVYELSSGNRLLVLDQFDPMTKLYSLQFFRNIECQFAGKDYIVRNSLSFIPIDVRSYLMSKFLTINFSALKQSDPLFGDDSEVLELKRRLKFEVYTSNDVSVIVANILSNVSTTISSSSFMPGYIMVESRVEINLKQQDKHHQLVYPRLRLVVKKK